MLADMVLAFYGTSDEVPAGVRALGPYRDEHTTDAKGDNLENLFMWYALAPVPELVWPDYRLWLTNVSGIWVHFKGGLYQSIHAAFRPNGLLGEPRIFYIAKPHTLNGSVGGSLRRATSFSENFFQLGVKLPFEAPASEYDELRQFLTSRDPGGLAYLATYGNADKMFPTLFSA